MANRFRQFRLLLWKNFILQYRRPVGTVFEILLPVLLVCVLIVPKVFIKTEENCFSTFKPLESVQIPNELLASGKKTLENMMREDTHFDMSKLNSTIVGLRTVAFYPNNLAVGKLMARVAAITGFKQYSKSWGSAAEMTDEVSQQENDYLGAIEFYNVEDGRLPKVVKYAIRLRHELAGRTWRTKEAYPPFQAVGPRKQSAYTPEFIALQYAVDMAILQDQLPDIKKPIPVNLQQLPYPEYTEDNFMLITEGLMPLLLTLAFMYSASVIVKELVNEKHERLKESMKMMGLANWVHWSAWFTKNLIFLLISVIIITAVVKGMKIFEYSDGFVVFIFFTLYAIASISFCFCISVFFSRPVLAMLFTMVLWYCSYVPFEQIQRQELYESLTRSQKAAACLLPNTCLGFAAKIFSKFESRRLGVTWDHVSSSPSPDDDFSMAWVFLMLILQSLMYGVITWYMEAVFPGKYGLPLPFYFPFKRSYWCGYSQDNITVADSQEMNDMDDEKRADVEEENHQLPVGVAINNLRKVFKGSTGSKVAVDGLTLNIFQNQITALLGHNGAGKTTTMSILTGLFPPTSGSGRVDGKSILTDMDAIRESLGLCPQHNVLFDRLTVKEHLEFFINLKGKFGTEAETEVLQMVNDIQLTDKLHWTSAKLSGGMKRKLSCAIALVGGSKTVFLDEPTSGMDPYARRATWDLLLKHKAGRTMILTTHFMDEADFLGDRIAIMADGQLRCCGSSLFLKSRYGVGYHLTLVKKDDCDVNAVTRVIMNHIPSAQLLSSIGAEMEFVLSGEDSKQFEPLFLELENKLEQYGITSFGVSCTTMEEVFMKVGEGSDKTVEDIDHEHQVSGQEGQQIIQVAGAEQMDLGELNTGLTLKLQQYKAMFMKRFLNSRREKKAIVTQLVLPMVMVLFGLLLITSVAPFENDPPRLLRLSNLSVDGVLSKAFYADFRNISSGNKSSLHDAAKEYLKTVKVNSVDVTSKVNKIQVENQGTGIYVEGTSHKYKSDGRDVCCNYAYLILNENCKKSFLEGALKASDCKNDKFGYKECSKCLTDSENNGCQPMSCNATNLKDKNTYFMEYVLENSDSKDYFNEYVAGFVFGDFVPVTKKNFSSGVDGTPTTVWYSNEAFHTIAEALSAFSNILLQEKTDDSYGIETTNHPLPRNAKNQSENVSSNFPALLLAIFLAMGMAFMAASFITFIVQERQSKAKHLQFVSGVDALSFWLATFTWDFVNYLIPMLGIFIMFIAFQVDSYNEDLGTLFLMLLLFGVNVLPFVYAMSFLFTSSLIAYAITVFVLSIVSMAMLITVFICQIPDLELQEEADIMHYVFMLLPTYTISYALIDIDQNYGFKDTCTASPQAAAICTFRGIKYTDHYLEWERPGVGQPALYMAMEALVLFALTVLIEVRFFMGARVQVSHGNFEPEKKVNEDEDVFNERKRIYNMEYADIQNEAVVVKDLTKVYPGTAVTAVDHLCLGIPRGTCFGLLGINGAGKTTTFGMLTGDLSITEGTAYMGGYSLQSNLREVRQRIGYCPQFDALIERLTGREMLTMYANLRGVPANKIKDVVSATIDHLSLRKWADKLCGDYSGGNKRKLSTAIALVGNPPIIFLDEPTTGMDPVARRYLWDALMGVLKGGRSIVLTSHSMEECEALCSMLAIMVNGQFKCLGSIQHLKSKYGKGYTMMIKVAAAAPTPPPAVNSAFRPPSGANAAHAPVSLVYSNPVAAAELPDVNEPQRNQAPDLSHSSISSRDVHPTIPPTSGNPQPVLPQYPVMTNVMDVAVANVQRFVSETFRGAQLLESHNGMLHYHVDDEGLTWSFIFGQIERNREKLNIVDYSVSQTSLDQVFINFAKEQHSEERTKVKKKCNCFACF